MKEEILKERERIKKKCAELLERLIARRQELKRKKSRSVITIAEIKRYQEHLCFWIDNPDYVRKENGSRKLLKKLFKKDE